MSKNLELIENIQNNNGHDVKENISSILSQKLAYVIEEKKEEIAKEVLTK
jgi:hypothetical protein